MEPQVFDLLVYLLESRDHVVSKDELIDSVWGGRIVSESTLTSRINSARKAVGETGRDQKLIRTIARKGIRFVGEVRCEGAGAALAGDIPDQAEPVSPLALPLLYRPTIAVLPFTNMSEEAGQEYFSDGISEAIITALSKLRWFYVIARNSSFVYKARRRRSTRWARTRGRLCTRGQRAQGRQSRAHYRAAQRCFDGHQIWSDHYDRNLVDVFAVQDEITEAIVGAIEPQLYAAESWPSARRRAAWMPGIS
jgi:TolB-like protein